MVKFVNDGKSCHMDFCKEGKHQDEKDCHTCADITWCLQEQAKKHDERLVQEINKVRIELQRQHEAERSQIFEEAGSY